MLIKRPNNILLIKKIIDIAQDLEKSQKENKIKFWLALAISLATLINSIVFGVMALIK